jgi:hypothetical protein
MPLKAQMTAEDLDNQLEHIRSKIDFEFAHQFGNDELTSEEQAQLQGASIEPTYANPTLEPTRTKYACFYLSGTTLISLVVVSFLLSFP